LDRTIALRFGIGILRAMPGRGHRLPAAWAIAACVAVAALLAGCDSHSKPQAVDDPSSSAPLVTAAPPPTSASSISGGPPTASQPSPSISLFP